MNSTTIELNLPIQSDVISDEDFVIINHVLAFVLLLASLTGVVTNSINIKTFISMGLQDGITVSLMGLSISDLGFTLLCCVLGCANIIDGAEKIYKVTNLPIQPKLVFANFSSFLANMCFQVTCMITTFMAVARSMCVAMPFQFKNFFTRTKSVSAMIFFVLIAMASYIPLLSQMEVQKKYDPSVNKIRIVLKRSKSTADFKDLVATIHFIVFVFISSFVVAVSVVIMSKYLVESLRFRNKATHGGTETDSGEKSAQKLSGKELQAVRQVLVICIIYTVCNIPTIVYGIYRMADKDFELGGRLNNLIFVWGIGRIILQVVNSASTFPVYYVYNTKFRAQCISSMCPKRIDAKKDSAQN